MHRCLMGSVSVDFPGMSRVPAYSHNQPELDYFLVYLNRPDYFNNRMVFDIENIDI